MIIARSGTFDIFPGSGITRTINLQLAQANFRLIWQGDRGNRIHDTLTQTRIKRFPPTA
jgi:hypothetical protein